MVQIETEFRFTDNLHSIRVATTLHFAVVLQLRTAPDIVLTARTNLNLEK